MPYRIFTISAAEAEGGMKELNQFLATHRVVEVDKRFHGEGPSVSWHFCVNYVMKRSATQDTDQKDTRFSGIDYKEALSPEDFEVFAKLRKVRKEIADEKAIQLFTILTNRQLAELATQRVRTMGQLRRIQGIGEKKATAFGQRFLDAIWADPTDETSSQEKKSQDAGHSGTLFQED